MTKKKVLTMVTALGLVGAVGVGGTLAYLSAQTTQVTNTFEIGSYPVSEDGKTALDLFEYQVTRNSADEGFDSLYTVKTKPAGEYTLDGESYNVNKTSNNDLDFTKDDWKANTGAADTGVEGINYGDIIPGSEIPKAPTVSLVKESPNSRIYVKLEGLDAFLEATDAEGASLGNSFSGINNQWKLEEVAVDGTHDGIYVYVVGNEAANTNEAASLTNTEIKMDDTNDFITTPLFESVTVGINNHDAAKEINDITVDAAVIQSTNVNTLDESLTAIKGKLVD